MLAIAPDDRSPLVLGRAGRPCRHGDGVIQRSALRVEREPRWRHRESGAGRCGDGNVVHDIGVRPDVGHGAALRDLLSGPHEHHRERRVVEVAHGPPWPGRAVCRRTVICEERDLTTVVAEAAEECYVIVGGGVVHQSRVEGTVGVDVARPKLERPGCLARGHVLDGIAIIVHIVGRRHHGRLDCRWAPTRLCHLKHSGDAAHVQARHGRAGDDVELDAPIVDDIGHGRRHFSGPCSEDVDTGGNHVGLEDLWSKAVRSTT
ncbi:Os02g0779850 [Oryza sativa Japonica Group]|uniref:Os02g0779850 protein n=1 Tax=Oryza sativa subsp. japonica TaxID=39947 RepID=A0A0P0VQQ1_ORYSJ|nr:hypothetical protein EE612_014033 [Oryza sativa]BAS81208.1 Os02g0779850 [Oryza sativa Japonica Group]